MKLKYITLLSFVLFVGGFVALAVWGPVGIPDKSAILNNNSTILDQQIPVNQQMPSVANLPKVTLDLAEITKHNLRTDCYLIVKGSVYNVTAFIDKHPGGAKKITERCGQEATSVFSAIHSNFAWNLLKDYYLGGVGEVVVVNQITPSSTASTSVLSNQKAGGSSDDSLEEEEGEMENEYEDD